MDLSPVVAVWNRALLSDPSAELAKGDHSLAVMLRAHSLVMNGGVLHAVEVLAEEQVRDAINGYQCFGLEPAANLLIEAMEFAHEPADLEKQEMLLDFRYHDLIPDDSFLFSIVEKYFDMHPGDFRPV